MASVVNRDRRMRVTAALVATLAFAYPLSMRAQGPVSFDREVIRVFLSEESIRVEGTYVFTTSAPRGGRQALHYPFPVDSLHPFPDIIAVRSGEDTLRFSRAGDGVRFTISLPPNRETTFDVDYEQRCLQPHGCYILTTTAAWERPLKRADFEVHVPDAIRLVSSTYDMEEMRGGEGGRVYTFSRTEFMPDTDLCLSWSMVREE
jgi:hypothetical protein